MSEVVLPRATHFSIVWAVTLAVLTLVEWRSLDREPMKEPVMLPFIERTVTTVAGAPAAGDTLGPAADAQSTGSPATGLQYRVDIGFNGPLFLACFFGPILLFQGIGFLARRVGSNR